MIIINVMAELQVVKERVGKCVTWEICWQEMEKLLNADSMLCNVQSDMIQC